MEDTGAPISVIPHYIWSNLYTGILGEGILGGVHQGKECQIPCQIGKVLMRITDNKNKQSLKLKPLAYPVPKEFGDLPLILGYDRCIEYFKLEVNIPKRKACLILE